MTSEWCTCDIAASSTSSSGILSNELPRWWPTGKWRRSPFSPCLFGLPAQDREGGGRQRNDTRFNGNTGITGQQDRRRLRPAGGGLDVYGGLAHVSRDEQRFPVDEQP